MSCVPDPCNRHREPRATQTARWERVAFHLLKTYPQLFSNDFDHNKIMVGRVTDVRHKAMRNRIAGYVCSRKGAWPELPSELAFWDRP